MTSRKTIRLTAAAGTAAIAMLLGSAAQAQNFSFASNSFSAHTNDASIQIPIQLSGASVPVAGVNFTVRMSQADAARLDLLHATGDPAAGLSQFTYAQNTLARTGVANGGTHINGDVHEFRAVIYSTTNPPATFGASSASTLATLTVPIPSGATAGTVNLELVSAIDNSTGLLGVSDAGGNSLVPGGGSASSTRPGGQTVVVTLEAPGEFPVDVDLADSGNTADWEHIALLGSPQNGGTKVSGQGLKIDTFGDNNFSFWHLIDASPGNPRIFSHPDAGDVVITTWTVRSTNGVQFGKVPARLGVQTGDFFYASDQTYVGVDNNSPDLTPNPEISYTQAVAVPAAAANNIPAGTDGLAIRFDALQFFGGNGYASNLVLNRVRQRRATPASLTGEATIYSADFSSQPGKRSDWEAAGTETGSGTGVFEFRVLPNGVRGVQSFSGGLVIANPDGNGADTAVAGDFAYGFWQTIAGASNPLGNADSTKLYRMTFTVEGGASQPIRNPYLRARLFTEDNKFAGIVTIGTDSGDATGSATQAGTTYEAYFTTPPGEDGRPLRMAFDMFDADAGLPPANPTYNEATTLTFTNVTLRSYNLPL